MWKKVVLTISIISILIIGIIIFNFLKTSREESIDIVKNETNLSKFVTDECIDEWEDYSITLQEELSEASNVLTDESKTYTLKAENGYINIYYLNEKNEEVLYKVTDISTKFLEEEDILKLETGIEIIGIQNVNMLLEDFE